ncbi:LuxR C-terminal-related transcriptional regulator [Deinococcus sp. 14RED07]|uniref:LuxR C-terminal-related transcriptional regulator n=1 Tax=Deinococcus sp. 14RED07 TaxID=2745874 RepID=UPI00351D36E2
MAAAVVECGQVAGGQDRWRVREDGNAGERETDLRDRGELRGGRCLDGDERNECRLLGFRVLTGLEAVAAGGACGGVGDVDVAIGVAEGVTLRFHHLPEVAVKLVQAGVLAVPVTDSAHVGEGVGAVGAGREVVGQVLDDDLRALKRIARAFNVSEGTVKNHVSSILTRLGLRDRTQAAIFAVEHGLS